MKIAVKNVNVNYRKKMALNDLSFTLEGHKIYGLLGRNGAGKTTLMKLLAGHALPNKGHITIQDENPFDNRDILQNICLVAESNNFHEDFKVKQVLQSYRYFYSEWDQNVADQLVQHYRLPLNSKVKSLSKGMSSALGVITGLASNAPITIFDEPYIGMDAAGRQYFYDKLLALYENKPRTFIFSTHLIDEVSLLFEEVLILNDGQLVLHEEADSLREQYFSITGEKEQIEQFIHDKNVIKVKTLANVMTAYINGNPHMAMKENLEVESIPIQELMIYLTERGEVAAK